MLDAEGEDLLIYNHSNPDYVRDIIYHGDEEESEADMELAESKKKIKDILRD